MPEILSVRRKSTKTKLEKDDSGIPSEFPMLYRKKVHNIPYSARKLRQK